MAITISVSTKSGSAYLFTQDGDKVIFLYGIHEGEVIKFKEPLRVGGHVNIEYYARNDYTYEPSKDVSTRYSSEITELSVMIS